MLRHITRILFAVTAAALLHGAAQAASSAGSADRYIAPWESKLSQSQYKMITEKDVRIPMPDGGYLAADIFRPAGKRGEKFPVLIAHSVYQKELEYIPHAGPFTHQERPKADWWVARGYVLIFVDSRGTGRSPGRSDVYSMAEARDFYQVIEWAGVQDWSTGKVGLNAVSYYAVTQWNVASLQPPHLTAMIPWEGFGDMYRDWAYHGGIFNQNSVQRWWVDVIGKQLLENTRVDNPDAYNENLLHDFMYNNLYTPWWTTKKAIAQVDKITVPFLSVGNWTSTNLHLRGNTEVYERAASQNKRLRIHTGNRLDAYYSDEGLMDQLRFYDHWLKGMDTGMLSDPPVKLCIRTEARKCFWRMENEFPLARTQYTKFYLTADPSGGVVKESTNDVKLAANAAPTTPGKLSYDAGPMSAAKGGRNEPGASFVTEPMTEDTEVTGHVNLVMYVESDTDDMDIFARLRKVYPDGTVDNVGNGALKVSHRKLDPAMSRPDRPYHTHDKEEKLSKGEVVEVQVEILATTAVYQKGTRIRLDILPHDNAHYFAAYHWMGNNHIYTGGDRASYILLPIAPPKPGEQPNIGGLDLTR